MRSRLDGKGQLQWHALGQRQGLAQSVESLRLWATQWGRRRLADDRGRVVEVLRWEEGGHPRWRPSDLDARAPATTPAESPACRPARARRVDSLAEYNELRHHLAALLLNPIEARLKVHPHWVISPDAELGALPLDILPWRGGMVAEHVRTSYVQSLSAMNTIGKQRRPLREGGIDLIAIGSPTFDREQVVAATGRTAPLPAAALEIRNAAAQFPVRRTLIATGPDATESRLRRPLNQGRPGQGPLCVDGDASLV